jgi:phospholipase C
MEVHRNGGKMDGFLKTQPAGDLFPISYYEREDLPVFAALTDHHVTLDRYFCSINGPTWPNRLYQLAAATDLDITGVLTDDDKPGPSKISTTIFDRALDAGLTAGYYSFPGAMMTNVFASRRYDKISHPFATFLTDAAAGRLPNVVFVDPDWSIEAIFAGTSSDMHPMSSTRVGERLIADVYEALAASPQWDRLVFVLNFDESGGFADHVPPPKVVDDNVNPNPGPHPDYAQLGPRVPCIVGGPFAPAKLVNEGPFEHTSVLRMIEWRWGLEPMSARDRNARNLADVLDFSAARPPAKIPAFEVPPPVCDYASKPI